MWYLQTKKEAYLSMAAMAPSSWVGECEVSLRAWKCFVFLSFLRRSLIECHGFVRKLLRTYIVEEMRKVGKGRSGVLRVVGEAVVGRKLMRMR